RPGRIASPSTDPRPAGAAPSPLRTTGALPMYIIYDPDPTGTRPADQQQRYADTRAAASRIFRAVQHEYARATELDTRPDDQPLTALERLELASLCATLADAFARAADIWDRYQPN